MTLTIRGKTKMVLVLPGLAFAILDRTPKPYRVVYPSYFQLPTDRVIISSNLTKEQKEVTLVHALINHPEESHYIWLAAARHNLDSDLIKDTYDSINQVKRQQA